MKYLHYIIAISMISLFLVSLLVYIQTPSPTSSAARQPTKPPIFSPPNATPTPTPDTRCLIKIDSVTYNVTAFKNLHSGGDIFICGTDMSTTFWDQHNQSFLDKMQKYRI